MKYKTINQDCNVDTRALLNNPNTWGVFKYQDMVLYHRYIVSLNQHKFRNALLVPFHSYKYGAASFMTRCQSPRSLEYQFQRHATHRPARPEEKTNPSLCNGESRTKDGTTLQLCCCNGTHCEWGSHSQCHVRFSRRSSHRPAAECYSSEEEHCDHSTTHEKAARMSILCSLADTPLADPMDTS